VNRQPDVELVLRDYFADDGLTAPDYVLDVVAERIGRQPRRSAWRLPRRLHLMNRPLTYAAALAAILVIPVVGYNLLPKGPSTGGPGATPTAGPAATIAPTSVPTAVPTAAAAVCDNGTAGCLGRLAGGTYASHNFKPMVTYTVPAPIGDAPAAAWANSTDLSRTYTLVPPGGGSFTFQVISEIAIPEQTADCSAKQKAGAGTSVAAWVDFLTHHPGLAADAPKPVTIGGFSGTSVRFARASSWTTTCPGSVGPAIAMYVHPGADGGGVRIVDDQQETYSFVDVAGETVLIIVESGPTPAEHVANVAIAQPIIDTFQFTPR
jgi:hypothetical protein